MHRPARHVEFRLSALRRGGVAARMEKTTYDVLMLLATWFTAIGTVGAVIVALRMARTQNRPSLAVRVTYGSLVTVGLPNAPTPEYLSIRVVNDGFRDAVIQGVLWKIGIMKRARFVQMPPSPPLAPLVPHRIAPGDSAIFLFDRASFEKNANNLREALATQPLRWLVGERVFAGVLISTGDEFLVKPDTLVMKWLRGEAEAVTRDK